MRLPCSRKHPNRSQCFARKLRVAQAVETQMQLQEEEEEEEEEESLFVS